MKINKKLRMIILTVLILGLSSGLVYAAYGTVSAISYGSRTQGLVNNVPYNFIDYEGKAKEIFADSNRIQNIYANVVCSVDSVSEDIDSATLSLFSIGSASVPVVPEKLPEKVNSVQSTEGYDEEFKIILNDLHEKELNVFDKSEEFKMYNIDNNSFDVNNIIYIDRLNLDDYPDYISKYIDYGIDHLDEGDYIPSGVYVNKENNELYIVSISDNKIYTYNLD